MGHPAARYDRSMSAERFVTQFAGKLRARATDLRAYGASDAAQCCERVAQELEDDFRSWWLQSLTVAEAAAESGYSEERLREMTREGTIPHVKGEGARGHLEIARCDLPRRPASPKRDPSVTKLAGRLLGPERQATLRGRR
jgi:hypothetical protein